MRLTPKTILRTAALAGASLLLAAGVATAAPVDVFLQAQSASKTLPGLVDPVPTWVFACDPGAVSNPNCTPSATGSARIDVAPGDDLTIHLTNTLPTPVSVVIPGQTQTDGGDPVMIPDALARDRVRSFTHETAAGSLATPSAEVSYNWGSLRPGTYLFQSGTHPSIQVPMGLHGAIIVGPATLSAGSCASGVPAYDSVESCYDADTLLVLSEIDPVQNTAVEAAAGVVASYPSTIDYNPTYILVNGETSGTLPGVGQGDRVLLRFLNAGLRSHTPAIVGLEMGLVAEDGNPYPGQIKWQSAVLLPAGKTLDLRVAAPAADVTFALFDRMPSFSNDAQTEGVRLAGLVVGAGSTSPPYTNLAADDTFPVTEDTPLVTPAPGVLGNDDPALSGAAVVSGPANGTLVLGADGSFTYTPNQDFSGADSFTYNATDGVNSYAAQVTLNVSFANDPPVAAPDGPYVNAIGTAITVDVAHGVLGNDADPDGDTLSAVISGTPPAGLTLNADGSFAYDGLGGSTTFSYIATDGVLWSDPATVTLTINPVANIALIVRDPAGTLVTDYRWLVQEDATFHHDPNAPDPVVDQQSLNFHRSYMPVVAQGSGAAEFLNVALDPAKHYYVSVLPSDAGSGAGHTIGGTQIPPGTTAANVFVNNQPIPTAQISVFVFNDNFPTNGAPDAPEPGLGGFQITLEDAGGRYGISGGTMMQDAFGNPLRNSLFGSAGCPGTAPMGVILTCPDGRALIKDLPPGKYGVIAIKPLGGPAWVQTSTIEGTKVIDAWVKANEPPFFLEFGGLAPHAFIGFVNPAATTVPPGGSGSNTIIGHVTLLHDPRPPAPLGSFETGSYDALAHTRAWVGLNDDAGGGQNIATVHADPDGTFTLNGIPDGTFQLVIWDDYLDQIIAFRVVNLPADAGDIGNVPVNAWFTRLEHHVFLDANLDGIRQAGESPLPEQAVNLRWRDGTVNQSFPTDTEGFVPFDQVFPFFSWQVAEVDYTRFKATGVTVTVDAGGDVSGGPYPGLLYPQVGSPRTETGPVLTQAFQSFPGQTSIFEWGKAPYAPGENGGISGIVFYGSTRGENDPRLTVGDPWEPGIPGVKIRLYREVATSIGGKALALVQEVETDSWDAALPEGCPGEDATSPFATETLTLANLTRCFDGFRNWNQVRPGVFDGGYAFNDIPPGKYVVEVVPPPGYELIKEEDINVGFGDAFATAPVALMLPGGMMVLIMPDLAMIQALMAPEPGLAQPSCVGALREVPPYLSLFPSEMIEAPFAGALRPLCDRKQVILSDQGQAAADFHLFTSTPVAAQFTGLVLDDISNEGNPASPGFGEKWGPANLPISLRDYTGREVYRTYGDSFGRYNGVLPSTFTANIPIPSGYSPAMMVACMNDPGDGPVLDPLRLENYGTACYTAQFMPGTTTYLDTPILPQAAFAAGFNPVDCASPDGTPVISFIEAPLTGFGPFIQPGLPFLSINSQGSTLVPNPAYEGSLAPAPYNEPVVARDYGFGDTVGTVTVGDTPVFIFFWTNDNIIVLIDPSTPVTDEIVVTRGDNGAVSINTATVTLSDETPIRVPAGGSIQDAIDAAAPGDLILVEPGTYNEMVVMWKPVRLQGAGGGSTVINAVKRPAETLQAWIDKVNGLVSAGTVDLLPGQLPDFATEQGAGITVLAKSDGSFGTSESRIDGFTIAGADGGGGIFVNGYAHNLEIANNHITFNSGFLHGGIRVGHPSLPLTGAGPFGFNNNVNIHHNAITLNGGVGQLSTGGGLALATGTDDYTVSENFICGNYTSGDGAGIGHLGLSTGGVIEFNQILFNQAFNNGLDSSGAGIFISGEPPEPPALTIGAGDVTVDANLIWGNHAGSGHGGGIRTQFVNGSDTDPLVRPVPWLLRFTNNMIVNNVAAYAGGGMSLQDTVSAQVINNTIVDNDSTATVGALIDLTTNTSQPQPAGISAERHSLALAAAMGQPDGFSNPMLSNNILWHNRAFSYDFTTPTAQLLPVLAPAAVGDCDAGAAYWDLGVLGEPPGGLQLDPTDSILTDPTGYAGSNIAGDPDFLSAYCNGARTLSTPGPMQIAAAFGEGGNFIDLRYGPLTQAWPAGSPPWDYHIGIASAGLNNGNGTYAPNRDFDGQGRPWGGIVDRGADEIASGSPPPPPPPRGMVAYSPGAFGIVPIGTTATLTITATVSVEPVTFTSSTDPAAPFARTGDTCAATTVAVGGTCAFTVTYTPTGVGPSNGSFAVTSDAQGSPQTVSLSGTGVRVMYFSTAGNFRPPGVTGPVDNADIYSWNGETFARVFDATAAGLPGTANIDALHVVDADTFYMSFSGTVNPPGPLGNVRDEDIVLYDAGVWSLFFDGSDVGLANGGNDEDVDAFDILPDGSVVISTRGPGNLPGIGAIRDEDLLRCEGTFGPTTSCTWSRYFDGSDVGMAQRDEDIDGASVSDGNIYLTTTGDFNVPGLTGKRSDVFVCNAPTTGPATACTSFSMYFDGSVLGVTNNLDAIDIP